MSDAEKASEIPVAAGWRFKLGAALFALSLLGPPVVIPLIATLGFSTALIATISGGILVGAEVFLVVAAAVMGKSGYNYIKSRTFGLLKQYGPPKEVSKARYNIGLAIFVIPILFGWLAPYAGSYIPGYQEMAITYAVVGDLLLLFSLFVLGGEFWDKLRALFIHDAKVKF